MAEARRVAQEHLDAVEPSRLVITEEREFSEGWVFFYQSRRHQETGDWRDALGGNAPLIVNRASGEMVFTATAPPLEQYLADYAEACRRRRTAGE